MKRSEWLEDDRFKHVSKMIESLCEKYELPIPVILRTYIGEPCDFTSPQVIRLFVNSDVVRDISYEDHAMHVFGHYLCNLEQTELSDRVVDIVTENLE